MASGGLLGLKQGGTEVNGASSAPPYPKLSQVCNGKIPLGLSLKEGGENLLFKETSSCLLTPAGYVVAALVPLLQCVPGSSGLGKSCFTHWKQTKPLN